jgi:DNA segregation ATPase FtsK/SpoIIIE, S-DNA-T family
VRFDGQVELLLELHGPDEAGAVDVHVEIEPEETVAALAEALSGYAARRTGASPTAHPTLVRGDATQPLDPSARVADTGLVSGDVVTLAGPADVRAGRAEAEGRVQAGRAEAEGRVQAGRAEAEGRVQAGRAEAEGRVQAGRVEAEGPAGPPAGAVEVPAPDRPLDPGVADLVLAVTAGPEAGRIVVLHRDVVVGRGPGCGVTLDDPTLSRRHFALRLTPASHDGHDDAGREGERSRGREVMGGERSRGWEVMVCPNPEATNGTFVEGEPVVEPRRIDVGQAVEAGSSVLVLRQVAEDETRRRDRLGLVPFNRVPYRPMVVRPQRFADVPPPPAKPTRTKLSIAASLMPAASSAMMVTMTGNMMFLGIAALSPLMMIFKHLSDRRGGRKGYARERKEFRRLVEERGREVGQALDIERQTRLLAAPDLAELAHQAAFHQARLWERNRTAGDLLELRLGLGDVESRVSAGIAAGGEDALREEGLAQLAHQHVVRDVPVGVNLVDVGAVGLWGDAEQVVATSRALLAQAACLHSPEDVVLAAAVAEGNLAGFEWLKWLPHTRAATSPIDGPHVEVGPDGTRRLLVGLLQVVADRHDARDRDGAAVWPRVVVLLDEAAEPDRALLSQLLDVAPAFGVHLIWAGTSQLQVPRQCNAVVGCAGVGRQGRVRFTDPAQLDRMVELDGAQPAATRSIARALAPLRDAGASRHTAALPRTVSLLDTVGLDEPTPAEVARRWQRPQGYGLAFPLGMAAEGPFVVDLVEHGPHALVAGTSGSGKSELLQTLVLSLAANYSPRQVNFLFVDYKGGASSAELRDLPHTVGYVTNLSGRMSLRALTSLRAELQRRMALMEGKAKDLRELLRVAPDEAPPSLVIVVDEFATLVKEIPDFVAGIVDIAQRGRSLGVHLILATQRPTGVVSDHILANTNLRISLRVLDRGDSQSIVGTADAAEIPVPLRGRAYARVGPQALVSFQSAWSSAPLAADAPTRQVEVSAFQLADEGHHPRVSAASGPPDQAAVVPSAALAPVASSGRPAPGSELGPGSGSGSSRTQLDLVVGACAGAAGELRIPAPRRPWLEPLGEVVTLASTVPRLPHDDAYHDPGRLAVLGLSDDPATQAQHVALVDLEATGGLVVFGTGGAGKTTLLRTLAASFAQQGTPDEVRLYVLDFASRSLDVLADLPHCAAVITGEEVERTARLLTVLDREIEDRRRALAAVRAESLGALRARAQAPGFPRLVVLLDGYQGFHATFDRADRFQWHDVLQRIVAAGRQVGVHCVVTSDRRQGLPASLMSVVSSRLALRMASAEDLSALGVPTKVASDADLPNGRGFLDGDTEVQVACVSDDPPAVAQAEAVGALAARLVEVHAERAPGLPELPIQVGLAGGGGVLDAAASPESPSVAGPMTAPFGVVDLTLAPAVADLRRQSLLVLGPPESGRSTALAALASGLRATSGPGVLLAALGSPTSPLRVADVWDDAAFLREEHVGLLTRLVDHLAGSGPEPRTVLFVDAVEDVDAPDVQMLLDQLGAHGGLRLVAAVEPSTLGRSYTGWLSNLRRNRSVLMLQPEDRLAVEAVTGVKPDLRPDQDLPPGRGIFVANRRWQLVHVAQTDQHPFGAELLGTLG